MTENVQPVPSWQKKATIVVYSLVVLAFLYIGWAWLTQRTYDRLMADLMSSDARASGAAAERLAASDDAMPYLTTALVNEPKPEHRALAAKVMLRRWHDLPKTRAEISPRPDMEAVTRALSDESPDVRYLASLVVDIVGTQADYQRQRLEEMKKFDGLLGDLASADEAKEKSAAESLQLAGERALPFLVGTVLPGDNACVHRGLGALDACVEEILKSSNQRRIVPLLERRRCGVLLAALPRLEEADRAIVIDLLDVSGRLPKDFFTDFLRDWAPLDARGREKLVAERILQLESDERLKGSDSEKIEKLSR